MNFENKPKLYMMVGLPGSGKTTFAKHLRGDRVSTDDFIEWTAESSSSTYNEVFDSTINKAKEWMKNRMYDAIHHDNNIIWDQTNLTEKSRRSKLLSIPDHYEKICLYFPRDFHEIWKLNEERKKYGRSVPDVTLDTMIWSITSPKESEGFDKVYSIRF